MADDEIDPITKRICQFIRMFSPSNDNTPSAVEANEKTSIAALMALRNLFDKQQITFHELADIIEKGAKGYYSGEEIAAICERAEQEGYAKAKREVMLPPEFYDASGKPNWYAIALYIDERKDRLPDWERGFVEGDARRGSLVANMAKFGSPTPKQSKIVLGIFIMLGGTVPPEVMQQYR